MPEDWDPVLCRRNVNGIFRRILPLCACSLDENTLLKINVPKLRWKKTPPQHQEVLDQILNYQPFIVQYKMDSYVQIQVT